MWGSAGALRGSGSPSERHVSTLWRILREGCRCEDDTNSEDFEIGRMQHCRFEIIKSSDPKSERRFMTTTPVLLKDWGLAKRVGVVLK
jgi:hypothetical protein